MRNYVNEKLHLYGNIIINNGRDSFYTHSYDIRKKLINRNGNYLHALRQKKMMKKEEINRQ